MQARLLQLNNIKSIFLAILLITSLLLAWTPLTSHSQERENRPMVSLKKLSSLTSATGWMKNPAGQWESGKNKIPWRLAESNSILKGVRAYSLGADNFDEYGFYSATFNGESFYVLIKRFTSGSYAYPNIYKGWYDGPHYFAYALTSQEAGKLRNIANGENNRILIKYFDFQFFDMKDQRDAIESIKKTLGPQNPSKRAGTLVFEVAPNKEKSITRFQIYHFFGKESDFLPYGGIRDNNPTVDGKKIYGSSDLFNYCYFETTHSLFEKFLSGAPKL